MGKFGWDYIAREAKAVATTTKILFFSHFFFPLDPPGDAAMVEVRESHIPIQTLVKDLEKMIQTLALGKSREQMTG
ncbi:hypothetical protein ACFX15_035235 [Malus domestica]